MVYSKFEKKSSSPAKRGWSTDMRTVTGIEVTKDTLLAELEEARQIAKEGKNGSAMAACTIGKARITGNIIDRREVRDVGPFDGLTDDELISEATRRARELGIGIQPSDKPH